MSEREKESKRNINIRMLYIWKKIKDMKIRTKLYIYLILVVFVSGSVICSISYFSMRETLIDNVEESAISLMKQTGDKIDERIQEFQEASYSLLNKRKILSIMEKEKAESDRLEHALNESAFNEELFYYNILYQNSEFVIMEALDGEVYSYNAEFNRGKISSSQAREILEKFSGEVTKKAPIKWMKKDGQVYFIRRAVHIDEKADTKESGLVVFAVKESFFECGDDSNPFVENEHIVVAGVDTDIYKNSGEEFSNAELKKYMDYRDGSFHVYATNSRIRDRQYLVISLRTLKFQWNLLCLIPYGLILEKANQVIPKTIVTIFLLLSVGLVFASVVWKMIRQNLVVIEEGMRQYEAGDYSRIQSPVCYDEIGMLILQFNHMGMRIMELNENARREQEEKQSLQYQVMEAQINPHFLYNTLGTLKWMSYEKEQDEIARFADAVIQLLRFTVKNANQMISFGEEIKYIKQYVYIQKVRYEDAFDTKYRVSEEAKNFPVLGFILQPFVENSILHGLDNSRKDGVITIIGEVQNEMLHITIEDNGIGMEQEKLEELKIKVSGNQIVQYKGFNGIGMTNSILRLKMLYGEAFYYEFASQPGVGTRISMAFPRNTV